MDRATALFRLMNGTSPTEHDELFEFMIAVNKIRREEILAAMEEKGEDNDGQGTDRETIEV